MISPIQQSVIKKTTLECLALGSFAYFASTRHFVRYFPELSKKGLLLTEGSLVYSSFLYNTLRSDPLHSNAQSFFEKGLLFGVVALTMNFYLQATLTPQASLTACAAGLVYSAVVSKFSELSPLQKNHLQYTRNPHKWLELGSNETQHVLLEFFNADLPPIPNSPHLSLESPEIQKKIKDQPNGFSKNQLEWLVPLIAAKDIESPDYVLVLKSALDKDVYIPIFKLDGSLELSDNPIYKDSLLDIYQANPLIFFRDSHACELFKDWVPQLGSFFARLIQQLSAESAEVLVTNFKLTSSWENLPEDVQLALMQKVYNFSSELIHKYIHYKKTPDELSELADEELQSLLLEFLDADLPPIPNSPSLCLFDSRLCKKMKDQPTGFSKNQLKWLLPLIAAELIFSLEHILLLKSAMDKGISLPLFKLGYNLDFSEGSIRNGLIDIYKANPAHFFLDSHACKVLNGLIPTIGECFLSEIQGLQTEPLKTLVSLFERRSAWDRLPPKVYLTFALAAKKIGVDVSNLNINQKELTAPLTSLTEEEDIRQSLSMLEKDYRGAVRAPIRLIPFLINAFKKEVPVPPFSLKLEDHEKVSAGSETAIQLGALFKRYPISHYLSTCYQKEKVALDPLNFKQLAKKITTESIPYLSAEELVVLSQINEFLLSFAHDQQEALLLRFIPLDLKPKWQPSISIAPSQKAIKQFHKAERITPNQAFCYTILLMNSRPQQAAGYLTTNTLFLLEDLAADVRVYILYPLGF